MYGSAPRYIHSYMYGSAGVLHITYIYVRECGSAPHYIHICTGELHSIYIYVREYIRFAAAFHVSTHLLRKSKNHTGALSYQPTKEIIFFYCTNIIRRRHVDTISTIH